MSILKRLLGNANLRDERQTPASEVEAVRRIARELEAMEPERARYVAAFAYLLSRVANADLSVSEEETLKMERIVQALGHMPPDQAALVVEIAKGQNRLFGGTENFLVTRELRDLATREQCLELLDCLFAVSAADESISGAEETQIRQIASELGFTHAELVQARSAYNDKREILKGLPGRPG
ncbi:MAG TPA: TerB family tellurite resistance protein [Thermoanaerobaculia bacterium]|nr:TerB family tellurite resistance protein [Thermoanaerobaculia bacterium]